MQESVLLPAHTQPSTLQSMCFTAECWTLVKPFASYLYAKGAYMGDLHHLHIHPLSSPAIRCSICDSVICEQISVYTYIQRSYVTTMGWAHNVQTIHCPCGATSNLCQYLYMQCTGTCMSEEQVLLLGETQSFWGCLLPPSGLGNRVIL